MEQPKREPCYAWLNKWFARENEGAKEPSLAPETSEALGCTETGLALRDLGGESGRTLNAQAAERLRPRRRIPDDLTSLEAQRARVRSAVARRIGLQLPEDRQPPRATACGSVEGDVFRGVKLLLDSEDGIFMPSLLLRPKTSERNLPVILFVSELGKPFSVKQPSLVVELVRQGFPVLAVDVRGSGETDPRVREFLSPVTEYDRLQFRFDTWAVEAASLGTTMLAMRTYDVVRGIDYLESCQDLPRRRVLLIGEGLGGVWALAAAAFDGRPAGAICVAATPSYKLIVESQYYALRDYYWVSGALRDFDLPDLIGLAAPKSVTLIDPVDAMLRPIEPKRREQLLQWSRGVYGALGVPEKLQCVGTADGSPEQVARQVVAAARRIGS